MLELFVANQSLDINNVNFTITLKNPLFATEASEGSYIYNFTIPATLWNRKILQVIDPLQIVSDTPVDLPFSIHYDGLPLIGQSLISVKKVTRDLITLNAKIGTGHFNYLMKDQDLHRLDLGEMSFADITEAGAYFDEFADRFYPETPFALPFIDAVEHSYLPESTTGYYYKDSFNVFDPFTESYDLMDGSDKGIVVPMLFNQFVLKRIFELMNYTLSDEFFATHEEFSKLILFNTYNINGGVPGLDGEPGYYSDIKYISYKNHVPRINVKDYVHGLQSMFNCAFFFHHLHNSVIIKDLSNIINSSEIVEFSENVLYKREVSTPSFNGFILQCETDSTDDYFAEKIALQSMYLELYGGILDKIEDLPDQFLGDWYYYVNEDNNFYKWTLFPLPGSWTIDNTIMSYMVSQFATAKEELTIKTPFSTLCNNPTYGDSFMTFAMSANKFRELGARLVFFKGYQNYGGSYTPRCHFEYQDNSLFYKGETGLYAKQWKSFLNWRCQPNKNVSFEKFISSSEIQKIDFWKKYRIHGENYFIKEIRIPFQNNIIQAAKLDCFKI